MKIGFIGGGNMAEAMISAILNKKLATSDSIKVSDIVEARRFHLVHEFSIHGTNDNREAVRGSDVIVLSVKPQNLNDVLARLQGQLAPEQLVISIIAGKSIATISHGLNHQRIVRSMPNTPAQIGEGITVWTATPQVTDDQKKWTGHILGSMGTEIFVNDEDFIDKATAVSGSGPAYVFFFIESMVTAAMNLGFTSEVAEKLVLQTLLGAGHLVQKSGKTPAELRRLVTSPGGTTAEAIARFERGGLAKLVNEAVRSAYEKAKKLGS